MTNYINGFNERYIQCADVNFQEAMFRFLDGLEPTTQAWVRARSHRDLRAAMQAAEELGSTLATVGLISSPKKKIKIACFNPYVVG